MSTATLRFLADEGRDYACETIIYDAAFIALAESLSAAYVTTDERLAHRLEAYRFVRFLGDVAI